MSVVRYIGFIQSPVKTKKVDVTWYHSDQLLFRRPTLRLGFASFIGGGTVYVIDHYLDKTKFLHYAQSGTFYDSDLSTTTYASQAELKAAIATLRQNFPKPHSVELDRECLESYGFSSNSHHASIPHAVIVRPESTEDVVRVVNISRQFKVPIIPYSGATSLEGHYFGHSAGSICLDMSNMDQILQINEADADVTCQAGVRWEDLNQSLQDKGIDLFFPIDPGPGATIGGMISTGCSGTNAVRYGTARGEWFLNVTVVLPSGQIIKTRRRARKSSTGFDTTKLFVGAEGTLGIVTEATLKLTPVVPTRVAMAQFPDVGHAVSAVQEILNTPDGSHVQCVELLDDNMMHALNTSYPTTYPPTDTLFLKLQGSQPSIEHVANTIQGIVQAHGCTGWAFAETAANAEELWQRRKWALGAGLSQEGGPWKGVVTDVCVPVSKLPQLVLETKNDLADAGIKSTIVGHVGDGNFHALLLFKDDDGHAQVTEAARRLARRAIALDGTCTGEHGIGIGKKEYLIEELGEGTVELMKTIKKVVDPYNLFNPGKLYPDQPKA